MSHSTARYFQAKRHQRAIETHQKFEHDQSSYSLDDEQGREKYRGQRRMIERIEIREVKAIQSLVLDFTKVSVSGRTTVAEFDVPARRDLNK